MRNGQEIHETAADVLPRHSVDTVREQNGGVERHNFLNWRMAFVDSVKDLTANNRKLILTYDAYRSHTTLDVLELFNKINIIVYALPAHTSGKKQPLNVVLFSTFKNALNESTSLACSRGRIDVFNVLDFYGMLTHAYQAAFTKDNIVTAFTKSDIRPVDSSRCCPSQGRHQGNR